MATAWSRLSTSSRKKPPIISLASANRPSSTWALPPRTFTRAAWLCPASDSTPSGTPSDFSALPNSTIRPYTPSSCACVRVAR
jgi:hypothetical protein